MIDAFEDRTEQTEIGLKAQQHRESLVVLVEGAEVVTDPESENPNKATGLRVVLLGPCPRFINRLSFRAQRPAFHDGVQLTRLRERELNVRLCGCFPDLRRGFG